MQHGGIGKAQRPMPALLPVWRMGSKLAFWTNAPRVTKEGKRAQSRRKASAKRWACSRQVVRSRGRYGTPPVRMGSAARSRREGKAFPTKCRDSEKKTPLRWIPEGGMPS